MDKAWQWMQTIFGYVVFAATYVFRTCCKRKKKQSHEESSGSDEPLWSDPRSSSLLPESGVSKDVGTVIERAARRTSLTARSIGDRKRKISNIPPEREDAQSRASIRGEHEASEAISRKPEASKSDLICEVGVPVTSTIAHAPRGSKPVIAKELARAKRIFREKFDNCSEADIVDLTKQLNGRIENIALNFPNEYEPSALADALNSDLVAKTSSSNIREYELAKLVKKAMGQQLFDIITTLPGARVHGQVSQSIVDACQLWTAYCAHSATKPLLFGFKVRTAEDIQQIFQKMKDGDPELAEYWLQLKDENLTRVENGQLEENSGLKPRPSDQQPEIFIEEIGKLTAGWSYDNTKEYLSIEQVYRRLYGYAESQEEYQAISAHWRGILHEYSRQSPDFASSQQFTLTILRLGLQTIFELADKMAVFKLMEEQKLNKLCAEAIQFAIKVSDSIRSSFFSANLGLTLIKPGATFDASIMDKEAGGHGGPVLGTIHLGIGEIGPKDEVRRVVLRPKVILA